MTPMRLVLARGAEHVAGQRLATIPTSTSQEPPVLGPAEPAPRSLSPANLRIYFRGARFAAQAMGLRHGHHAERIRWTR